MVVVSGHTGISESIRAMAAGSVGKFILSVERAVSIECLEVAVSLSMTYASRESLTDIGGCDGGERRDIRIY